LEARNFSLNEGKTGQEAVYARREWDSEFGKTIPPRQRKKTQKKKDEGRLFILSE